MQPITDAEKLARALLMFFDSGAWSPDRARQWRELMGEAPANSKTLCDLARKVRISEEAANQSR